MVHVRYQNVSRDQRVYSDIRTKNITLLGGSQEVLTPDFFDKENELVHLVEFIVSQPCEVTFEFSRGEMSRPKTLNPGRVFSFQDLAPITSIIVSGESESVIEVAIAV